MKNWKVTTNNRSAAKRLLTAWHDSRQVRTWTLAELDQRLTMAVNDGLMTHEGIARALGIVDRTPPNHDAKDAGEGTGDDRGNDAGLRDEQDDNRGDAQQGGEGGDDDGDNSGEGNTGDDNDSQLDGDADGQSGDAKDDDSGDDVDGTGDGDDADDDKSTHETDCECSACNTPLDDDDDIQEQRDESQGMSQCDDCGKPVPENELTVREHDGLAVCVDCDFDPDNLKHEVYDRVKKYIAAGLNVALVGPAGTGKSYMARQIAEDLGRDFYVNGAMMSKYDLIGYCDAHGEYHATPAHDAFTKGGIHCFDELDASAPEAVVAFNGMTDDQPFYTFPCGQRDQHEDYVAIACMNTYGNGASADYVGRFKQDAAAMDRFVTVYMGYDARIEELICGKYKDVLERVRLMRASCEALGIRKIVSYRMFAKASKAREQGVTRKDIDTDILFSGLDDSAIEQVRAQMNAIKRMRV